MLGPYSAAGMEGEIVSIVEWLIFGIVAGCIAGKFVNWAGEGGALDTMLSIVGVMACGLMLSSFGPTSLNGLNTYGIFLAVIAAIGVMLLQDAVTYHSTKGSPIALAAPPARTQASQFRRRGNFRV